MIELVEQKKAIDKKIAELEKKRAHDAFWNPIKNMCAVVFLIVCCTVAAFVAMGW